MGIVILVTDGVPVVDVRWQLGINKAGKRRGREKFRECNQLLRGTISSLKMKGSI